MTTFEYLAVLISIIVGLGITHLLGGVARLISNPSKYKMYWVHLVWIAARFGYLAMFWWFQLWMNSVEEWTALLYMFLIVWTVLLYVQCAVLMPTDFPADRDFRKYFFSRKGWFFGLLLASQSLDVIDSIIKGHWVAIPWTALFAVVLLAGLVSNKGSVQAFVAVFALLSLLLSFLVGGWDLVLVT